MRPSRAFLKPYTGWRSLAARMTIAVLLAAAFVSAGLAPRGAKELFRVLTALPGSMALTRTPAAIVPQSMALNPKIIIPAIGVNAPLVFPERTDIATLDAGLARGVVHYPGSAAPGEQGNVFLFGHSTGLAVVHNRSYAVFNRVPELRPGDTIRLRHGTREHWYHVTKVGLRKADEVTVDLNPGQERRLTISTCRSFGAKDERFVIEAEFAGSYPLWSHGSTAGSSS